MNSTVAIIITFVEVHLFPFFFFLLSTTTTINLWIINIGSMSFIIVESFINIFDCRNPELFPKKALVFFNFYQFQVIIIPLSVFWCHI